MSKSLLNEAEHDIHLPEAAMSVRFVIGVDGGGTGCRVLVKDRLTGRSATATGGPANVASDFDTAIANVKAALAQAASVLGVTTLADGAAHVGLAGVYTDAIANTTTAAFSFAKLCVADDRAGAVEGYLDGQDGFLVVAGTGMIVASSSGRAHRFVGGHGFQLSDHGSGAWIGRHVLEMALWCHDGMQAHSALTGTILKQFSGDANEIVAFGLRSGATGYAALAPLVIEAAQADDPHGVAIMERGARHIEDALRALGFQPGARLCLAGGIGPHFAAYLTPETTSGLMIPEHSALDGAVRLAQKLAEDI